MMYTAWYSRGDTGVHHQMGVYHHGPPMIKTEAGINSDCMMAVDYGATIKKASASSAFVWSGGGIGGGGGAGTHDPNNSSTTGISPGGTTTPAGTTTQGLVHWMSVMAEHMGASGHHDPAHYTLPPWNNGTVEGKLSTCNNETNGNIMSSTNGNTGSNNTTTNGLHQHSKGEERPSHHHHNHQTMSHMLYGAPPTRSGSSSSSPVNGNGGTSASTPASLLVVPQPLGKTSTTKLSGHTHSRKYHCKMCPQVSVVTI